MFHRIPAWCRSVTCLCLLTSGLIGCQDQAATTEPTQAELEKAAATKKAKATSQSENLIHSILAMLKLESLGVTAQEDDLVGLLNQWQRFSQGTSVLEEEEALDESVLEAWRAQLNERKLKNVRMAAFQRSDIERLRSYLLINAVTRQASAKGKSDLERVGLIFENLIRNTDLIEAHPDETPMDPYQLYLLGNMTAADRGWLFVEMLRQLNITAVLLSAPLPSEEAEWDVAQPFVVGVLLNDQIYLFDPRLGLALTVPGAPADMNNVATLAQVLAQPDILKQYQSSDDKPYGVTQALLQKPAVWIVGDPAMWSYRFARLQRAFTGDHAMVISERPIDVENSPGVISRVAKWPNHGWDASQIRLWDYPDRQFSGQDNLSAQHQQTLTRLTDSWKMPVVGEPVELDGGRKVNRPRATNLMLAARLDHSQGKLDDAMKGYTRVRVQLNQNPEITPELLTPRLAYAYQAAAEESLFWMCVCKIDQGGTEDIRVAIDKLRQYLGVFPQGRWAVKAHLLFAQAAAQAGEYQAAIELLKGIPAEHPQYQGILFLKRQWESKLPQGTPESPAATPATEKPADMPAEKPAGSGTAKPADMPETTTDPKPGETTSETSPATPAEPQPEPPATPAPETPAPETPAPKTTAADPETPAAPAAVEGPPPPSLPESTGT